MAEAQILVVEDENIVAKDIQNRLTNMGYEVPTISATAEDAIHQAGEKHPDLVLMDIMLKGELDGIAAAEKIHELFNIPVIYLTAYSDEHTLSRAKYSEPFGYLLKPFEERELHTTIEMALYKHKMERRLRESEQWLSTILRSIGDAVIATDKNGRVAFMNPVAETLTGWNQSDALGRDLTEVFNVIDEKTRTHVDNPAEKVFRGRSPLRLSYNLHLIARDGAETPIDDSAAPIHDAKGNLIGVVLTFRDITERRVAEEVLRQHASYLIKRVKELQCLYAIFRIVEQPGIPLDEALKSTIAAIPPAWQHPEVTAARILLDGEQYATPAFAETQWKLVADIQAMGRRVGTLEVVYLQERPNRDEGPFLKEERSLINAIAAQLGHVIERRRAEESLQRDAAELNEMVRELNCACAVSATLENPNVSLDDAIVQTVESLPSAIQYPEVVAARVILDERHYTSVNFRETEFKQEAPIRVGGRPAGCLQVFYDQPQPKSDGQVTQQAEETLIHSLADQIGSVVERKNKESEMVRALVELERVNGQLSRLADQSTDALQELLGVIARSVGLISRCADETNNPMEYEAFVKDASDHMQRALDQLRRTRQSNIAQM